MGTTVAIRVDASAQIGTGHFMRCLTLAQFLARAGARVRFVSRALPVHLDELARAAGHATVTLPAAVAPVAAAAGPQEAVPAHAAWLGATQAEDANDTIEALADGTWDWLVVDHYALDARWEAPLRARARRICAIDDLADRRHDCDVLLDQNLHAGMERRYEGKIPAGCRPLLGPAYALLREEFARWRDRTGVREGAPRRLLVFMGGADADDYTTPVLEALACARMGGPEVAVVIGSGHPRREAIVAACAARGHVCHVQAAHMAELMAAADLAVGATGSASWERCCLGLPAIGLAVATNQESIADALDRAGAIFRLGADRPTLVARLVAALEGFRAAPERLTEMSRVARGLVDGLGAARVARQLLGT
jgi:UDP-2,4-diacetamido-2,4,6-trideoxy-beta-L-altropyranose hydrolase